MEHIPTTIHYCWFGKNPLPKLVKKCIESWQKTNPEFTLKRWDESSFDVIAHSFTKVMYSKKKWAFVADYARLIILEKEGGVYLDTDMMLHKNLTPLLKDNTLVLGKESEDIISAGMIASSPHHPFIKDCLTSYNALDPEALPPTIPRLLTKVFNSSTFTNSYVCPPNYFYPFSQNTIRDYDPLSPPHDAYGVHLWNFSWGSWYQRVMHKSTLYKIIIKTLELLRIKKIVKKLLRIS